ncbi:uncharacterized protein NEMAJ01_2290 [Nematocida major]|uniref:uncharacterized protein n=1 Tax=Nematocida major TaxID=1912982 RepID=UPI00200866FE|nr:uncharacterized protein NEMAJ01_2290 [Nematocida major]KAH9387394.1 hypothetical protein NEMAJ01_2290 [Nematocida major]
MAEIVVLIEGIKDEIAKHLFRALRFTFHRKSILAGCLEMNGLAISLLNPNYNGVSPNELKCREYFIRIAKSKNVLLINDIEYRREDYYTAEYNTDTKYILIIKDTSRAGPAHLPRSLSNEALQSMDSTHIYNGNSPMEGSEYYTMYTHCRNYKEKLVVLLCNIKKSLLSCHKLRVVHKLYLLTRYSNLCVLNTGYNVFYKSSCDVLEKVSALLHSMKNKYTLFIYTGGQAESIVKKHSITDVIVISAKGKDPGSPIQSKPGLNIVKIEIPVRIENILAEIEKTAKSLLICDVSVAKTLIRHIKREETETKLGRNVLVKLMVKGFEVTEKKYDVK